MAVSKQQQDQGAPLTPVVLVVAVAAAALAAWFQYPGAFILLIGVSIAGFFSQPPALTGPKDPVSLRPTVGNPGERKKVAQHQFWQTARTQILVPAVPWPMSFEHVAGLGAALVAFTLPIEGTYPLLQSFGAEAALPAIPFLNALAAYLLATQLSAVRRRFAAERDPKPATMVADYLAGVGTDAKITSSTAMMIVFAGGLGAITWWWLYAADWYYIYPAPVFGAGVLMLTAAGIGHQAIAAATFTKWSNTVESRAVWEARFAAVPKLKERPQLISHERHGEQEECWIDVFEAPMSNAAVNWTATPTPDDIAPTLPPNTVAVFMSAPDTDVEGQPILLSRSKLRYKVITWKSDFPVDIEDPNVDRTLLAAWLEMNVTQACVNDSGADFAMIPLGPPEPLFAEAGEYPEGATAAWKVSYGLTVAGAEVSGSLDYLANVISNALGGAGVYPFGDALYVGAVTAPTTDLLDPSIIEQLEAEAERSMWAKRWTDMTGIGLQNPSYFPEHNKTARLSTGETIHSRLFMAPQGLTSSKYFDKVSLETLQSGLPNARWASLSYFVDGNRQRYPNSLHVFWSEQSIPLNPAAIGQSRDLKDKDASRWALTGAITRAFAAAKLDRPEVVKVEQLTKRTSRSHVWELTLALYGGVTLASVKKAREQLRLAMGGCDWIRISEAPEGCRIAVGSNPNSRRATELKDDSARFRTTALDWEFAFSEAKVENSSGQVPMLINRSTLPKNELVSELTFSIPPGLSIGDLRKKRDALGGTTGNSFLEIRPGDKASQAKILSAEDSPLPNLAPFKWDEIPVARGLAFADGVEGEPVVLDVLEDPHLVVMGSSGSGKSAFLQSVLTAAAIKQYELHIFDKPKLAADYTYLFPYAKSVATDYGTIAEALSRIYAEVERRKLLNHEYSTPRVSELPEEVRPPHMLVMIDEFTSTLKPELLPRLTGEESKEQMQDFDRISAINHDKSQIGLQVGKIMREARSAGVSMLVAGQTMNAADMKESPAMGNIKNQAATVLLGKASFGQKASAFKDIELVPDLGETVPKGRGIFEGSAGAPLIFQSWFDGNPSAKSQEGWDGREAGTVHLESMVARISAVRDPETDRLTDAELRKDEKVAAVFGEIIAEGPDSIAAPAEVIDLGEVDLDWDDLDFESLAEPENGNEAASPVGAEAARSAEDEIAAAVASAFGDGDSASSAYDTSWLGGVQVGGADVGLEIAPGAAVCLVAPTGVITGIGSGQVDCEYGVDQLDTEALAAVRTIGEVVLLSDDAVLADALGFPAIPVPFAAELGAIVDLIVSHAPAGGWGPLLVITEEAGAEDDLGISLADYFADAGLTATVARSIAEVTPLAPNQPAEERAPEPVIEMADLVFPLDPEPTPEVALTAPRADSEVGATPGPMPLPAPVDFGAVTPAADAEPVTPAEPQFVPPAPVDFGEPKKPAVKRGGTPLLDLFG
ncbi:FtsK/SpoIIIE domain-containing protein [Leucobacter sp. cx-169]|uniref:FtsK/SpoIIIE domain-containing protein n=1 Tax=Leucobacter sp. cx-169 TaxID=2770549 RepID=UPI00165E231F|nr:FtsK/SpoIIIE domain-containing protein [Leucobacter sp. cx-169]MBC9927321.1 hypothetical protein [Leucobacter sp. cx-169]